MTGDDVFRDRAAAGRALGARLADLAVAGDRPLVLGLPRGGVTVAAGVASTLGGELDVVVARKISHPSAPELALGALAEGGGEPLWDRAILDQVGRTPGDLLDEVAAGRVELARRVAAYRGARPPIDVRGRAVVVVDDGVATGATARAALRTLRARGAARLVLAVPVAPPQTLAALAQDADEVVTLLAPSDFVAVGRWYDDFAQLTDDDVRAALLS